MKTPPSWTEVFKSFRIPIVPEPYLPHKDNWFKAWELCSFEDTKCVIIGQDPYHTPGLANGLAFSVQPHITSLPPSLNNIFTELRNDLKCKQPSTGSLEGWASSGVLLLNTTLTVQPNRPGSHSDIGWWHLVRNTINYISNKKENVVFIAWGKHAQSICALVDQKKHMLISSSHPSPYSASISFFGSRPFSTTNGYLTQTNQSPIHWCLS